MWTSLGQIVRQVVAFGTQVALARLLAPEAFGLVAMMTIASEFAMLFADFGIGSAIVQKRDLDRRMLSTCFWLNMGVAAACAGALGGAGPLMATYFGQPELVVLTLIAGVNLLVNGATVIPQAIMLRNLQFRQLTFAQVVGSITGSVAAIGFALLGGGVWSLAVQPVVGSAVTLALMARASDWWPDASVDLPSVRSLVTFSGHLLGVNLIGFAGRNMHSFLIGKSLGSAPLGIFNMAQTVAYMPAYQISVVVQKVLFPTMSRLQDDRPALRNAYLRATGAVALFTFPMMIGLFSTADDLVPVVLGKDWLPMVDVLKIVVWGWMVQTIGTIAGTILVSIGDSKILLGTSILSAVLTAVALLIGIRWGLLGVAMSVSIATILSYCVVLRIALSRAELAPGRLVAVLWRPCAAAIGMMGLVLLLRSALPHIEAAWRLAACIAGGAATYVALTFVVNRQQVFDVLKFARAARR